MAKRQIGKNRGGRRPTSPSHPAPSARSFPDPGRTPGPSGPEAIHAPWRLAYLEALDQSERTSGDAPGRSSGGFLHAYWLDPEGDDRHHVIVRTAEGFILLNGFPYATGHLLVALGDPRPTLLDYSPEQRATLWRLVDTAAALVQRAFEPQGINIGMNQGRAAGAGVPGHLHVHLVPRWSGDVNFISVVGGVRVIPASLETAAARYRRAWTSLTQP